jgi:DNA-binding IclR family transcriptional regulator
LLNLNSLAADCGIAQPTARRWLTVLQASDAVALLHDNEYRLPRMEAL